MPSSAETTIRSSQSSEVFRISGHQTFALRIAWIPKAVQEIAGCSDPFTDVDEGIVRMGLGKNMVESLRVWIEAFQVADKGDDGWRITPLAKLVFGKNGLDQFMEDVTTVWLLHWLIATNRHAPFFAWECMFNRWPSNEFNASAVIAAFRRHSDQNPHPASAITLKQHWEVFLNTYRPPRIERGEDNLDSALSVLRLIRQIGERPDQAGRWEPVYAFDTGMKPGLSQELFTFFLNDWWDKCYPEEKTIPFRDVINSRFSPGRMLKMSEAEIALRLSDLAVRQRKVFFVTDSVNLRQIGRSRPIDWIGALRAAYTSPTFL
jgi:hypothetical protein